MTENVSALYLLPWCTGLFAVLVPEYSAVTLVVAIMLYLPLLWILQLHKRRIKSKKKTTKISTKKVIPNKKKKRVYSAIGGYYAFTLFSLYLTFPLIRVLELYLVKIVLIAIWILVAYFVNKHRTFISEEVLGENSKYKIVSFVFAMSLAVILLAGGGGFFKAAEYFSFVFGDKATLYYFSSILYLSGLWFTIFIHSNRREFQ